MDLKLFLVEVVVAFAGAALIRYAVPVADPIAGALFTSGIVALMGGLILFGLAAAVRSLSRIAKRLEIQPLPLPPVAAVNRERPAPAPAAALVRLRSRWHTIALGLKSHRWTSGADLVTG
jgi:hypothetical protein